MMILATFFLPNFIENQGLKQELTAIAQADAPNSKQRIEGFQKDGWKFDSIVCPYQTARFTVHEVFGYRSDFTKTINSEALNAVVLLNTDDAKAIFMLDRSQVDFCGE
ncbi:MAG: hypothetical protein RL167_735 [Actinomycetota bacterium]